MGKQFDKSFSKNELTRIIDDFHFHITIILLCMNEVDALCKINNDEINKKQASNFFYITHSSLIFRYEIELAKLVVSNEERSVFRICSLCKKHIDYFSSTPENVTDLCKQMKKTINSFSEQNRNLISRRNAVLAHSDSDYYFYNKKYVEKYDIDFDKLKQEAEMIYSFAKKIQIQIDSKRAIVNFPTQSDDVKHLFGMKTDADLKKEELEEKLKKNWNNKQ